MLPYLQMAHWKALKKYSSSLSHFLFLMDFSCDSPLPSNPRSPPSIISTILHSSFMILLTQGGYLHFRDSVVQLYDRWNSLSFKETFGSIHFINIYEFTMICTHIHLAIFHPCPIPWLLYIFPTNYFFYFTVTAFVCFYVWEGIYLDFFLFWSILLNMIWLSQSICHKSYDFKILYFLGDK